MQMSNYIDSNGNSLQHQNNKSQSKENEQKKPEKKSGTEQPKSDNVKYAEIASETFTHEMDSQRKSKLDLAKNEAQLSTDMGYKRTSEDRLVVMNLAKTLDRVKDYNVNPYDVSWLVSANMDALTKSFSKLELDAVKIDASKL